LFPVKTAFRKVGEKMKTALLIYWSKTGNTEKVAYAIKQGLEEASIQVTMKKPEEAEDIDYFNFDLVCVGAPSYSWHLPEPMTNFLKKKFAAYRQQGKETISSKSSRQERIDFRHLLWTSHRHRRGNSSRQGYPAVL